MGKISINLDESTLSYLDKVTENRSAYINNLIRAEQKKAFNVKLETDYLEQSQDIEWQTEVELWDSTASDGLNDSVEGAIKLESIATTDKNE